MAVGYKCRYYPSTVIDILGGIQNSYNTVTLPVTARQLLANTLGKKDPKDPGDQQYEQLSRPLLGQC